MVDASAEASSGRADALILDHLLHGINYAEATALLLSPYAHLMQERAKRHFPPERLARLAWFFAGGGAYTQPRAIRALTPDAAITIAEFDPLVTRIAAERLYVDPADFTIHHGDARA